MATDGCLETIRLTLLPDPFGAGEDPFRQELCGEGQLDELARHLAQRIRAAPGTSGRKLLTRLQANQRTLKVAHKEIARATAAGEPLTTDAEWLLNNFYVVEEVLRQVRTDLPGGYYAKLPTLRSGVCGGLPRVYSIALALLTHTDSTLDEGLLLRFVKAYQTVTPLTIGELWAIPIMLRIALLDNLARLAGQMVRIREQRTEARAWLEARTKNRHGPLPATPAPAYVTGILAALGEFVERSPGLSDEIRDWLTRTQIDQADLLRREHQRQATNQVTIGNCITSLRLLSALDWNIFFEKVSLVEEELRTEPTGVYVRQDFATRDSYRKAIERLARGSKLDELEITRRVIGRARTAGRDIHRSHLGYYLIGEGQVSFGREIGYRPRWRDWLQLTIRRNPNMTFFGLLGLALVLLITLLTWGFWPAWWLVLVAVVPLSQIAVSWVNSFVCRLLPPTVLPRLDFTAGISSDCVTFVVIPGMLTQPRSASVLLDRLELHYLANPDPQLHFAILTDFADAPQETMPEDEGLLEAAMEAVRRLNERHFPGERPRFFVFHRHRLYNPAEGCWMGWERKRGKLDEFNRLLRSATNTSYAWLSSSLAGLPRIRFVLTLDADTHLPRDVAQALIGTLAHPLNQARISADGLRVESGYAILQPRVSFLYRTGRRSLFARLFAFSQGIDPYAIAVSDPYMDLFGKGSFTGKGLYDVDTFEMTTGRAFPENHILSHDLIESNFARCGLATDLEVFDDFPARYHAYARREHRWVRGDWQLLPWLGAKVPTAQGSPIPNPLPLVERWKIVDNLRRSLVPPLLVAFLVGGWLVGLPVASTLVALAVLLFPVVLQVGTSLSAMVGPGFHAALTGVRTNLPSTLGQCLLSGVLLADQAVYLVDAIGRTLFRLFVTRRRLLEWETAAATEARLGNGLVDVFWQMRAGPVLAVLLGCLVAWLAPESLPVALGWLICWALSPLLAWWLSLPTPAREIRLLDSEKTFLRHEARKIWGFFETFVGPEDHWLPPDNYQEGPVEALAPRTSPTNIGLLLTSTLAAHDLGYLSITSLVERLGYTLDTLGKLARYRGHFLNWYDTRSLETLPPAYVSTVDSGNLLACLLTLEEGLTEKLREPIPSPRALSGLADTLGVLRGLFSREKALDSELQTEIDTVQNALTVPPGDLLAWRSCLPRVEDRVRRWGGHAASASSRHDEFVLWLDRFLAQLKDCRVELDLLCPWLDALLAEQDSNGEPDWQVLRQELARPLSLERITALSRDVDNLASKAPGRVVGFVRRSQAPALVDRMNALKAAARRYADDMDFRFLYNSTRNLFAIGYHVPLERLDQAHYDLLASESCLTSFLTVARGEVPCKHWFQLGRPFVRVQGEPGLVSWGGTMFEYLMPRLFLHAPEGTLLDLAQRVAVTRQIEYGKECGIPWGISESAYNLVDGAGNYQYRAFGVPGLGLKRGLEQDLVIAPYATFLAIPLVPHKALDNLRRLAEIGATGAYGYHEAIDCSATRLSRERASSSEVFVIPSYMAHHQGMSLLALTNTLLDDVMPRRLASQPEVRAVELLLQERVPGDPAELITSQSTEPRALEAGAETLDAVNRRLTTAMTPAPRPHFLSNGTYSVMVTNSGSGSSTCRGLDVTRWRCDPALDATGQACYLRDIESGKVWSPTHFPTGVHADTYEVIYSIDKAEFRRQDGTIETHMEVTVALESNAEIRSVKVINHGTTVRELELTSLVEIVLAPHGADLAHPAFQKLFLETEYVEASGALLCRRRPRSPDEKPIYAIHVIAVEGDRQGSIEFETDRDRFVGRRRDLAHPIALHSPGRLSGTTGAVLDPVLSLRVRLKVAPGSNAVVTFSTAVADTREEALGLADLLHSPHAVPRVFELAWAHARVMLRYWNLTSRDAHLYMRLAGYLLFPDLAHRASPEILAANQLGQPDLWRHGISGDLPILLGRVREGTLDAELVRQLVAAHAFLTSRGLTLDLVILNDVPTSYHDDLQQQTLGIIRDSESRDRLDKPGGIFVRKVDQFHRDELNLLLSTARVVLKGGAGTLADQINLVERAVRLPAFRPHRRKSNLATPAPTLPSLQMFNGTGGFSADGSEYVLLATKGEPPAPWINVVANPAVGFVVSDSGSGYTWTVNSQQNRLTTWHNDPISDPPSEILYLRDEDTSEVWSLCPLPCAEGPTLVRHGIGYTTFEQARGSLAQELTLFVPTADPVKIFRLRLKNHGDRLTRLTATFYVEWVLGTIPEKMRLFTVTERDEVTGALLARNAFNPDFSPALAFAHVNRPTVCLTADRVEFLGRNGSLADPEGLRRVSLSGRTGPGLDPCAALQVAIELPAGGEEEIVFLLGETSSRDAARKLIGDYSTREGVENAFRAMQGRWNSLLGVIEVSTPDLAFNLLVNRWLLYQTISCRLWGRSGLYQSGGAYGFRDQLQDVMALFHAGPVLAREQILRAAAHQFREGDVQHWWHPPVGRGVRTRFSDDFLWLVHVTCAYVKATGDRAILDENVPFLEAPPLHEGEGETYGLPTVSQETASLYEHCVRALDHGWKLGQHGLPLMGIGDWNDGMNRVGSGGKGESVWVAWFQIVCREAFASLAEQRGDHARAEENRQRTHQLRDAVEHTAWDGAWYRRAWFDDGAVLGSAVNDECRIDSIAQSWAVLAQGDSARARQAVQSALDHLVRRDERLVLLFTPPFDKGALEPGYIKGYVPGIRENGGQYTHAAAWLVLALARLGRGNDAHALFDLLNPLGHASTPEKVSRYRVEPYVVAADVYGVAPHTGRGGWTWYTGSAGWFYQVAIEAILGLRVEGDRLYVNPCIPSTWERFHVRYRRGERLWTIQIDNPEKVQTGECSVVDNGESMPGTWIDLAREGLVHEVRIILRNKEGVEAKAEA